MRVHVDFLRALSFLFQNRRRTAVGKFLRSEGRREAAVHLEKGFEDRARITLEEIARATRVMLWHPSVCQNYKSQSGCKFGEKCSFACKEADRQPNERPKKGGGRGSVTLFKNAKQLGCLFQDVQPPKSKSILRKSTGSLGY